MSSRSVCGPAASLKDSYRLSFQAIGFSPAPGNRYAYFLAPKGPVERRDGKSSRPSDPVIVGMDETKHRGVKTTTELLKSECPVTSKPGANGTAIPVGVSGVAPDQVFIAVAVGNLDGDAEFDCWSIASFERTARDGTKVPAGTPLLEKSDVPDLK